jgi:hypothetical protein
LTYYSHNHSCKTRVQSKSDHFSVSIEEAYKLQRAAEASNEGATVEEILPHPDCPPGQDEASNFESILEQSAEELQRDTLQRKETQDAHFGAQPFIMEPDSRAPNSIRYVDPSISSHVIYSYYPFLGVVIMCEA